MTTPRPYLLRIMRLCLACAVLLHGLSFSEVSSSSSLDRSKNSNLWVTAAKVPGQRRRLSSPRLRNLQLTGWSFNETNNNDNDNSTETSSSSPSDNTDDTVPTYYAIPMAEQQQDTTPTTTTTASVRPETSTTTTSSATASFAMGIWGAVVAAFVAVGFLVYYFRKREINRWHEYRTHQILRAQDEAFDLNFLADDHEYDLELSDVH
mmetsp:Transcript_3296/g.5228  ORF Transcript_3296/g.5228 Transcript_3296/m.5228 type:complete len:207 (+) Transcript_3296:93-713(+)